MGMVWALAEKAGAVEAVIRAARPQENGRADSLPPRATGPNLAIFVGA